MLDDGDDQTHPEEVTLLDYVVGDLAPATSDGIRRHVETCAGCRERIVELAMEMDAIDQLPTVAIPHDVLREAFPAGFPGRRRSRLSRVLPLAVLASVLIGTVALFEIGGLRGDLAAPRQRQVIVHTSDSRPEAVVGRLLGAIPATVTVDRDDPRHLVVLVSDGDLAAAEARLVATSPADGLSYIVDVGGVGALPGAQP